MNDPARYGRGYPDDDGMPAAGWQQDCEREAQHWTDRAADLMKDWLPGGGGTA